MDVKTLKPAIKSELYGDAKGISYAYAVDDSHNALKLSFLLLRPSPACKEGDDCKKQNKCDECKKQTECDDCKKRKTWDANPFASVRVHGRITVDWLAQGSTCEATSTSEEKIQKSLEKNQQYDVEPVSCSPGELPNAMAAGGAQWQQPYVSNSGANIPKASPIAGSIREYFRPIVAATADRMAFKNAPLYMEGVRIAP